MQYIKLTTIGLRYARDLVISLKKSLPNLRKKSNDFGFVLYFIFTIVVFQDSFSFEVICSYL